ncbi:unnamed protein product, partial [Ectocarpus fasciculatus]
VKEKLCQTTHNTGRRATERYLGRGKQCRTRRTAAAGTTHINLSTLQPARHSKEDWLSLRLCLYRRRTYPTDCYDEHSPPCKGTHLLHPSSRDTAESTLQLERFRNPHPTP